MNDIMVSLITGSITISVPHIILGIALIVSATASAMLAQSGAIFLLGELGYKKEISYSFKRPKYRKRGLFESQKSYKFRYSRNNIRNHFKSYHFVKKN